jgi:Na+-translocating ferredoxin:NAD+ oxidoreductase RnfC subunit
MADAGRIARENGVVGAGGAAFPTHIKLSSKADVIIANAAECEPLLYKDEEILRNFGDLFLKGLKLAAESVGAKRVVLGIKEKHGDIIAELKDKFSKDIEIAPLRDTYPSGDEFLLVYDVTGRQIPKGGIPPDVGVVVQNVETLYNIGLGKPVVEKFITVAGDVEEALTLKVPIGISWKEIVEKLKIDVSGKGFILGGPMMGAVSSRLDIPVTKADSGLIILPSGHSLLTRKSRTGNSVTKIAFSCDQCMRCSDLCPRDLLGHGVKPHKAMISITMGIGEKLSYQHSSLYCCECGLCTLYACPEDLDPSRVMTDSKRELFAAGARLKKEDVEVNPMYEYRRTPTKLLIRRLGLEDFIRPHRYIETSFKPKELVLPLQQHRGSKALPVVKQGQRVKASELIGEIEEGKMGSRIFSPLDAVVKKIEAHNIVLEVV